MKGEGQIRESESNEISRQESRTVRNSSNSMDAIVVDWGGGKRFGEATADRGYLQVGRRGREG